MVYLLISFVASVIGAICGIGGGVIIKPCLDFLALTDASAASFMSGCTVLSMTAYSVGRNAISRKSKVDFAETTFLAIGASIGGIVGKQLFSLIAAAFESSAVKHSQSLCLLIVTLAAFLYTLHKDKIHTRAIKSRLVGMLIGLGLGIMSSFLGIGGGPINLVVFYYFFSMDTKTAAQNSLYVILFSQATSLITTLLTNSVPDVEQRSLLLMIAGGITGGIAGRMINKRIDSNAVDILFKALMIALIGLCAFNMFA